MTENIEATGISDEQAVNRLFELASQGQTDTSEYTLLDSLIRARMLREYGNGLEAVPAVQTAAA